MYEYEQQRLSPWDKLTTTTVLNQRQAVVIKQTYLFLSLAVFSAVAGGYIGATSEVVVRFFSSWVGWIAAILLLNVVPRIAIAARHQPMLGVGALVADGFLAGLAISPLLYVATLVAPSMILVAFMITGLVFLAVTGYVATSGRTFSAPRGLMVGIFAAVMGGIVLNSFMNIGVIGVLLSIGIGVMGVLALIYSTSSVLSTPDADSPIPGALALFAGVFNVFVATLNLLLRLLNGGRR